MATIICPQEGPQEAFLSSTADLVIYGGAAGGGKTYALLMEALRHIDNGKFGAVIFRKNSGQIFSEGGLWDTSWQLYGELATPRKTPSPRWLFPSGMKLSFAHMESEASVQKFQGSQIPLIMFDELTHFSRSQFFYMLSRNRSASGVRGYVRATCNPDSDSWVREFIDWWIDKKTGYPISERSGVVRWMFREGDKLFWADSKEDLWEQFGLETDSEKAEPKSVTFIASKLSDNKILMENDPSYLANLKALPTVERERLLEGNWNIRPAAGLYFKRADFLLIDEVPNDVVKWVRAWDFAATEDKKNNDNVNGPAYTAGVLIGKRRCGRYIVADVINKRLSASNVRLTVLNTAIIDKAKYHNVRIRINQDPGQAGKEQAEQYVKHLAGFSVVTERETGSKETRAEPFAAQCQGGNVDLLISEWNEEYLAQLESFPESKFKDMVDASGTAFLEIERGKMAVIPPSETADADRDSPWKF